MNLLTVIFKIDIYKKQAFEVEIQWLNGEFGDFGTQWVSKTKSGSASWTVGVGWFPPFLTVSDANSGILKRISHII